MPAQIITLVFKCYLKDVNGNSLPEYFFDIEYFDLKSNAWIPLAQNIEDNRRRLNYSLAVDFNKIEDKDNLKSLKETLLAGAIPQFRIRKSKTEKVEIISQSPSVNFNNKENVLFLEYGTHYLLRKNQIFNIDNTLIIASPFLLLEPNDTLTALEEEIIRLNKVRDTDQINFEQDKLHLQQEIEALKNEIDILLSNNDVPDNDEIDFLKNRITDLEQKLAFLNKEKVTLESELLLKTERIDELTAINEGLAVEINSLNTALEEAQKNSNDNGELIENLYAQIAEKDIKIIDLATELDELKEHLNNDNPNKLESQKVYSSIVKDIVAADEQMANSRFKLANISMNLKATVEKGAAGTVLGLIDFENSKNINGAAISDIQIDIVPNITTTVTRNLTPNVVGLTETAARKLLATYGLKIDVVYQHTENNKFIAGQSFKQAPAAGEEVMKGQEVIVLFAKNSKI